MKCWAFLSCFSFIWVSPKFMTVLAFLLLKNYPNNIIELHQSETLSCYRSDHRNSDHIKQREVNETFQGGYYPCLSVPVLNGFLTTGTMEALCSRCRTRLLYTSRISKSVTSSSEPTTLPTVNRWWSEGWALQDSLHPFPRADRLSLETCHYSMHKHAQPSWQCDRLLKSWF